MVIDRDARARQAAAVDDAAVVQAVAEDDVVAVDQRGNNPQVGRVPRGKCNRGFCAQKPSHAVFEFGVWGHIARNQRGRRGAVAVRRDRVNGRAFEGRMVGQAQIVVCAKEHEFPAVHANAGFLAGFHAAHGAVEILRVQGAKFKTEIGQHGRYPFFC